MERTESTVVQVAPSYENEKIKQMEQFGWSLQGRQEMREEGDAYGRPSLAPGSNAYVVKTRVKHYVKLHFVRSLELPNLVEIKQIESELDQLAFPAKPPLTGPIILMGMGILPLLVGLSGDANAIFPGLVSIGLGGFWLSSRLRKGKDAAATCLASAQRMQELKKRLCGLL